MRVLVACECSGVVRSAFREIGHDAWSCDILPADDASEFHIQDDVLKHLHKDWDLLIAHPPCAYLTLAGNKWMKPEYKSRFPNREEQRRKAIEFFLSFTKTTIPRFAIENPTGIMSRFYRKPTQIIQPYEYGHPIRKTTCLWLNGLLPLRPTNIIEPEIDYFPSGNSQSKWHTITGHIKCPIQRSKARSITHYGIAKAMAEQWGKEPTK